MESKICHFPIVSLTVMICCSENAGHNGSNIGQKGDCCSATPDLEDTNVRLTDS